MCYRKIAVLAIGAENKKKVCFKSSSVDGIQGKGSQETTVTQLENMLASSKRRNCRFSGMPLIMYKRLKQNTKMLFKHRAEHWR